MMKQWTYVYYDKSSWMVMHQIPDPLCPNGRVISTILAKGYHSLSWDYPTYGPGYAAKQVEIGLPYATPEWPLKTC